MKTTGVVFLVVILFAYCSSPSQVTEADNVNTANKRFRLPKGNTPAQPAADTLLITEVQKLPVLGRSEAGVNEDLEGTWVLKTLNGSPIADSSSIHAPVLPPKKGGTKTDSVVTTSTVNGTTETVTEVTIQRTAEVRKITPPQGNSYHIPARPSLSFYGSNETFAGFTGCNKIAGRYKLVSPNYISFQQAAPSTKMACIGDYDETKFVNTLYQVKTFVANSGTLQLMDGNKVLMVFERE